MQSRRSDAEDSGETKVEKYVRCRLNGMSDSEACEAAGYLGRTPSRAIEMYRAVAKLSACPDACKWYARELEHKRAEVRELELMQRACSLIP